MNRLKRLAAVWLLLAALLAQWALAETKPEPTLPPFDASVPEYDPQKPEALTADQLYAESCILINQNTGEVLFEKNADMQMNPASCTKIMTLLLAVEAGNPYEMVRIPPEAAQIPADSSKIPVEVGEEMTFIDLMYGFMLRSGNDGGNAIAVIVAGSVDAFVERMNEKAQEIGCTHTHFTNAHGYTAEGHYTTARDLALMTQYAMQYDLFRKVVSVGQYTMNASNKRGEYIVENSNKLVVYGSPYRYRGATGVKTGTTSAAGQCLVSSATRDGISLIGVCMKSTVAFQDAKFQDSIRLLDYGFSQFKTYSFMDLYQMLNLTRPISGAAEDDPSGGVIGLTALPNRAGDYSVTVFDRDLPQVLTDFENHLTFEWTHDLTAPIEAGTIIGNVTFAGEDGSVVSAVLVSDRAVAARPGAMGLNLPSLSELMARMPFWLKLVLSFIGVFLLILLLASIAEKRRRKKRRKAKKRK